MPQQTATQASASWGLIAAGRGVGGSWVLGGDAQSPRAPGKSRRGARQKDPAGKEPPPPRALGICAPRRPAGRASASPGLCGADALPVCEQGLFPFTPSGSVFMKNFLLLALWEYSFLACLARG